VLTRFSVLQAKRADFSMCFIIAAESHNNLSNSSAMRHGD
jgi:hypothetical protein